MPMKAKKPGKRYSDNQKSAMLTKYHRLRKSGTNAEKSAKKVGVHYNTILKWENQAGKPKVTSATPKKTTTMHRGKKKRGRRPGSAAVKTGGLVLVTPNGFRIEGISSKELARVLRELK